MTVGELITELSAMEPTALVTIDTLGFSRGIWPAADIIDDVRTASLEMLGEHYGCVVLEPSPWP
jgi:hypothetical protein